MRTHTLCFSVMTVAAVLLAVGCNEVEDRLSWSPDGSRAILRMDGNLHFVDTNGALSTVVASNVTAAAWLPDGRGLVVIRSLVCDKWKDAENLLPTEEVDAAKLLAKGFLTFGVEGMEQFELKRPELASPAILYLFDAQSNTLHEAVKKSKDPAKLEADLSNMRTTQVAEVSVVALDGKQLRVFERTLTELSQPRPSPTAAAVAFLRGETLMVAPLDGSTNRVVATDKVMGIYDWKPDGRALVYAVRQSEKDNASFQLAEIQRRIVFDTNGVLVAGDTLPLTMNASTFRPRVRCLPDGRALFAGISLQLPGPTTGAGAAHFFVIDPALGTNAVPVALPSEPGTLPQDLGVFAPSPDGRQIAIVESGSDAVAVLDVGTGDLQVVSPNHGWKSRMLPVWRGTNELYFAALPYTSSKRPELLRWRHGTAPQVFSRDWPDEVVGGLLEKPSK